jgi:TonB family protein
MTADTSSLLSRVEPMPAGRRYGIATGSSMAFHVILLLLICLLAGRKPVVPEILIPIELSLVGETGGQVQLGGGGRPEAEPKEASVSSTKSEPVTEKPSSKGESPKAAPAPPKLLTSEKGEEPSVPVGEGDEAAGPGGPEEKPAGPTRGPGAMDGAAPIYPKDALDRGLEGKVSVSVSVAGDGSVSSVSVAGSSGHDVLDQAAMRAVRRDWRFLPALENGQPTSGSIIVTFEFASGKVEVK